MNEINSVSLKDLVLTDNGMVIDIPKKFIEGYKFMGMTNVWFLKDKAYLPEFWEEYENWFSQQEGIK